VLALLGRDNATLVGFVTGNWGVYFYGDALQGVLGAAQHSTGLQVEDTTTTTTTTTYWGIWRFYSYHIMPQWLNYSSEQSDDISWVMLTSRWPLGRCVVAFSLEQKENGVATEREDGGNMKRIIQHGKCLVVTELKC
jgi:hypothetical protein